MEFSLLEKTEQRTASLYSLTNSKKSAFVRKLELALKRSKINVRSSSIIPKYTSTTEDYRMNEELQITAIINERMRPQEFYGRLPKDSQSRMLLRLPLLQLIRFQAQI